MSAVCRIVSCSVAPGRSGAIHERALRNFFTSVRRSDFEFEPFVTNLLRLDLVAGRRRTEGLAAACTEQAAPLRRPTHRSKSIGEPAERRPSTYNTGAGESLLPKKNCKLPLCPQKPVGCMEQVDGTVEELVCGRLGSSEMFFVNAPPAVSS